MYNCEEAVKDVRILALRRRKLAPSITADAPVVQSSDSRVGTPCGDATRFQFEYIRGARMELSRARGSRDHRFAIGLQVNTGRHLTASVN